MSRKRTWRILAAACTACFILTGCSGKNKKTVFVSKNAKDIVKELTLEQKAAQMVIPAIYKIDINSMKDSDYGSILSTSGFVTENAGDWSDLIDKLQKSAMKSDAGIPFIYGQDSVHGVNYCVGTVIFPHNINIGMADDKELTYKMGLAVADEMKMTKMIWNYSPCIAVSKDPRWGRTYESYSSDPEMVKALSSEYTKGLINGGVQACAKHYIGDGYVKYGTGEDSDTKRLIDRGNSVMTDKEIDEQLSIYKALIDEGVQSIMVSHSSLNGVKMHENKRYLIDKLRGELGFKGLLVSDWNSIQNINSVTGYKNQIITAVNSGIDMLMEPDTYNSCAQNIVEAVKEGSIKEDRINEAVTRIIQFKINAGLFKDPYLKDIKIIKSATGSEEYRNLASKLVSKSQVLIKNKDDILPLKKGSKIFVCGPAANDTGVQCGGWTRSWNGQTDVENGIKVIDKGTTILEALKKIASENNLTIITDKSRINEADVVLLCIGEKPYAEWNGDTADLSITGSLGLPGNKAAIKLAKDSKKPTVTLLIAGRNVVVKDYIDNWDGVVMSGLFGSEGQGVADVLTGKEKFTGHLSMPWYDDVSKIEKGDKWLDTGYGLKYKN